MVAELAVYESVREGRERGKEGGKDAWVGVEVLEVRPVRVVVTVVVMGSMP